MKDEVHLSNVWTPTTPDQLRFWVAWTLYPDRATDSSCFRVRWQIDLDVPRFERALEILVAETDALRLVFRDIEGRLVQRADDTIGAGLEIGDFAVRSHPSGAAIEWLDAVRDRPIDLETRAFSMCLARCGDKEWIWQLTQHHIANDYYSNWLLLDRLNRIYHQSLNGDRPPVVTYPSFLNFVEQNPEPFVARLVPPDDAAASAPDICPALERSRRKTVSGSTRMVRHKVTLGSEWGRRARQVLGLPSTGQDALFHRQIFQYFVAATVALCARLSDSEDVTLGLPNHNRYSEGCEDVVGLFMRVLPLSFALNRMMTLNDLRQHAAARTDSVLNAARQGKPVTAHPYSVVLNYLAMALPDFGESKSVEVGQSTVADSVGLDLSIRVQIGHADEPVRLAFDVNEDLTRVLGSDGIATAFRRCLDATLHTPDVPLAHVQLVSDVTMNETRERAAAAHDAPLARYTDLIDGFLSQVQKTPQALALAEGERSLCYAELEARSRALAHSLVRQGIGHDATVALTFSRSVALIVAMLGVLRAGAAFYVVDPDLPRDRLKTVFDTLRPRLVLGDGSDDLSGIVDRSMVADPETLVDEALGGDVALPRIQPDWPMYVMFSSGTTGTPKGIVVPHGGFARYLSWAQSVAGADSAWNWAFASTAAFEITYRCFISLVSGGAIFVYPRGPGGTGQSLIDALTEDKVDFISLTPSHLRLLVRRDWSVSRLKSLVSIGEKLPTSLAQRARAAFGAGVSVENWYGPTETVMATTMHRYDPAADHGASVPVGRSAPCSTIHVLDAALNPVPPGMLGEVHIGGSKMSLGYLNRPDLNLQKFIPDPFDKRGRLFKTGDIGWVDADGNLVFHGRADDRMKINGVWAKVSDIELAVLKHPDVEGGAVIATGSDQPELVCFFAASKPVTEAELRAVTAKYIGRQAVPSQFHRLEKLPLTPNGKINRKDLQDLCRAQAYVEMERGSADGAVATHVEGRLCQIWSRILNAEEINRHDDFFDLGGDSLAMVRMILDVEDAFNLRISGAQLNRVTTIAQLADLLDRREEPGVRTATAVVPPDRPQDHGNNRQSDDFEEIAHRLLVASSNWHGDRVGRHIPVFLFNAAGTLPPLFWCFNGVHEPVEMAQEIGAEQPLFAMRSLNGIITDSGEKQARSRDVAAAYVDEMLRLQTVGPYLVGGNCQSGVIAEEIARQLMLRGRAVTQLTLLEHTPTRPYPGRLALFYGASSEKFNPFLTVASPELLWQRMHKEVVWDIIPGNHGQYFRRENLPVFMARLRERMRQARGDDRP